MSCAVRFDGPRVFSNMGKSKQLVLIVGIIILVAGGIVGGRYLIQQRFNQRRPVIVPRLSSETTAGEAIFLADCATCHGKNAEGIDKGRPS